MISPQSLDARDIDIIGRVKLLPVPYIVNGKPVLFLEDVMTCIEEMARARYAYRKEREQDLPPNFNYGMPLPTETGGPCVCGHKKSIHWAEAHNPPRCCTGSMPSGDRCPCNEYTEAKPE